MLAGRMLGAYRVTPAEPVSNIKGRLTEAEPTCGTRTNSRFPEEALGYRLMEAGDCIETVLVGVAEEFAEEFGEEPAVKLEEALGEELQAATAITDKPRANTSHPCAACECLLPA